MPVTILMEWTFFKLFECKFKFKITSIYQYMYCIYIIMYIVHRSKPHRIILIILPLYYLCTHKHDHYNCRRVCVGSNIIEVLLWSETIGHWVTYTNATWLLHPTISTPHCRNTICLYAFNVDGFVLK